MSGAATVPVPAEIFTLFPKVPTEVQHLIWYQACTEPRVLTVRWKPYKKLNFHPTAFVAPALLHACYQSRYIGLKVYEEKNFGRPGYTWSNETSDILYMNHEDIDWTRQATNGNSFTRILAVNLRMFVDPYNCLDEESVRRTLQLFPALERLIVVMDPGQDSSKKSITGFCPVARDYRLNRKEKAGKAQINEWFREQEDDETCKLPIVKYQTPVREVDWKAKDRTIQGVLKFERDCKREGRPLQLLRI